MAVVLGEAVEAAEWSATTPDVLWADPSAGAASATRPVIDSTAPTTPANAAAATVVTAVVAPEVRDAKFVSGVDPAQAAQTAPTPVQRSP